MSTMPKPITTNTGLTETPSHTYHAEAYVLNGHIENPIDQEIHRQALVELNDEQDGDLRRSVGSFKLDETLSFDSGCTEISGSRDQKTDAWVTVAQASLDRFNVSDVVTVDGTVARISTNHPVDNGHVPFVSFEGTKFENFRINGNPVRIELDLAICGGRPDNDLLYTEDLGFLEQVEEQVVGITHSFGLPSELKAEYDKELNGMRQLIQQIRTGQGSGSAKVDKTIKCSLVKSIEPIPGVKIFGNILEIPDFGIVSLGDLEVGEKLYKSEYRPSNYFAVTMITVKLRHKKHGKTHGPHALANGHHVP